MHASVLEILARCGTEAAVLPPTQLYNEGWLLRLLLDWFARSGTRGHPLSFEPGATWYSEALLPSRFRPTKRRDILAESFTHADGVVGHFRVRSGIRGDVQLLPHPRQFMVIEAKLGSSLSAGTKNAPAFDQAARNVACIAHLLSDAGAHPTSLTRLAFFVAAPERQIKAGVFGSLVTADSIKAKVADRMVPYDGVHDSWHAEAFLPVLERIDLRLLAWEDLIGHVSDAHQRAALEEFYARCLQFNPMRRRVRPNSLLQPTAQDSLATLGSSVRSLRSPAAEPKR